MNYLKAERFPTIWCPGCGLDMMVRQTAKALEELDLKKSTIVSGIGCTGRAAGYFNLDSFHGVHGRAIPVAEGLKLANPELNVVVISGDGDIAGIGGNHLLHSARRNTNITVICVVNETYGLTGGQMSPTTPKGTKTKTSPKGSEYEPIDLQKFITTNKKYFFARTLSSKVDHMKEVIKQAMQWEGFALVEVRSPCFTNMGRGLGFKAFGAMYQDQQSKFHDQEHKELEENEMGVMKR